MDGKIELAEKIKDASLAFFPIEYDISELKKFKKKELVYFEISLIR